MRPEATNVCGLELLVDETQLLVYEAFRYYGVLGTPYGLGCSRPALKQLYLPLAYEALPEYEALSY
jgi:hypothetical protein